MKFKTRWLACALALGLGIATIPAAELTHEQVLESWGWNIAHDKNVAGVELNAAELSLFLKGFSGGAQARPAPVDSPEIFSDVLRLAKARREKVVRAIIQKNEAAARSFFSELNRNTNLLALPGGIRCEILAPGTGAFPKLQQTVNVHYTARLIDGTEFDQMGPIDMVLVTNRSVCRGWTDAFQKFRPGGRMKLYVPPPLSLEDAERRGIEPGSAMVFEIELLDVKDTSPEDLANSQLPAAPEPEPPAPSGSTDAQIIETWGWTVARQTPAGEFGLSAPEISSLAKGVAAGVRDEPAAFDLHDAAPQVAKFVAGRKEQARLAERRKRQAEMETLFASLRTNSNVVQLADGLRYEIVKPGHGPFPKPGQIVLVDYTARLANGAVFDKTYNEPLHIEVGSIIAGWNEGIQKINLGGRIKLYIPPELGYGNENRSGVVAPIPADSTLIYEIELLEIQDPPKEDASREPVKN
jgi:FKBP-type peptidyl-prolyl cis-trans isomerase